MNEREQRRSQLLRAARDVFITKGYHDAKVEDIVSAADVAKGTFYLYFTDKRAVFAELIDSVFQRLSANFLDVDVAADIEAQVKHNIRAVIAVLSEDPALTRIFISYAAGLDPPFVEKLRSFYGGVRMLLEKALQDGQAMGIVADGDPGLYAVFAIGALKEVLVEYALERKLPREEIVNRVFSLLQSGFLRLPDRPAQPAKSREKSPSTETPKRTRRKAEPAGR